MIKKKTVLFVVLWSISLSFLWSQSPKCVADSLYQKGKYPEAAQAYEHLLQEGEHADLYYNLGNAYYRMNDIGRCILNYERAALRDPGNSDIQFNLALARTKTIDKIGDDSSFFIIYWVHCWMNTFSADGWAYLSLVCFFMAGIMLVVLRFLSSSLLGGIFRYACVVLVICVLLFNVFAWVQRNHLWDKTGAVILKTTPVKSTPANSGTTLFTLHPGVKVKVTDSSMKQWREITLPDGKKGWVEQSVFELI